MAREPMTPHSYEDEALWEVSEIQHYLGCCYGDALKAVKQIPALRYGKKYKCFAGDVKEFARNEMRRQCGMP